MEIDGLEMKGVKNESATDNSTCLKIQKPKRLLHFSDGVMEEYSDNEDEMDSVSKKSQESAVSTKDLPWAPYIRHKAHKVGTNVLAGIDYVGGGLATLLGITASEAEIAAAKRGATAKENQNEEHSNTWNPPRIDAVVSTEAKSAPDTNARPN